jgi:hypothetical protein
MRLDEQERDREQRATEREYKRRWGLSSLCTFAQEKNEQESQRYAST